MIGILVGGNSMNIIESKRVTKVYGKVKALDELSFTLAENKITGLIGRNGAGKTTLLKIVTGLIRQTSGELTVFGNEPFNNLFVSANSIFINADLNLPDTLTLTDILEAASTFYKNWDAQLARKLFEYFSFHRTQSYRELSKGMKSTFNMILGLASRCKLTIFDEPTIGMDAAVRSDFYRALLKDYIAHPRSILISSHHLDEIEHLLEDVLLLKAGKVRLHQTMSMLREWAIGVRGKKSKLGRWLENKEVIYKQTIGSDEQYVVIRNDLNEAELTEATMKNVSIHPVKPSELAIYLTGNANGGIDDVFHEAESF